jgi:hypothetical protein
MRILLANEPRSHREVFAGALRALRPHLEVITVKPDAVVCSRITPALRTATGSWMEVRIENGKLRVRTTDTGSSRDPDPGLDVLLQFVDRGEEQSRNTRQTPDTHREPGGGR